jgi:predicted O-linked N-acetylglucosamine transferase (SPINDLY family)
MNSQSLSTFIDLANHHFQAGNLAKAEAICLRVLELQPENEEALFMAGTIAFQQCRYEEALVLFERAAVQAPAIAAIRNNIGTTLKLIKRLKEATIAFTSAVELQPDYGVAWFNLGSVELENGNAVSAELAFRRCLEHDPNHAGACHKLGQILADRSDYHEALALFRKSEMLHPESAILFNDLGNLLKFMGRTDEAVGYYSRAIELLGDDVSPFSNKLLCMLCCASLKPEEIFNEHRRFGECFADQLLTTLPSYTNDRSPDRPLKIGYVSRDFKAHPVAFFIEPILASHDRNSFSIYAYLDLPQSDSITDQLRQHVANWRPIDGISDDAVAEQARLDEIDILVDLGGHTAYNRLLLFARKPSPIQVTWLGYAATTGLRTIDYRITDDKADPPGMTEAYHTETLFRLPDSFICYRPAVNAPDVGPLPAREKKFITFAAFNHFAKFTHEAVATWSHILTAVPASHLLIKAQGLHHPDMQEEMGKLFSRHGISVDRLEFYGKFPGMSGIHAHLDLFNQVDISLDTFPYNGTTTTCESLWMGVPVITLAGNSHVSRVGVSILTSVGLQDMIARDRDDYVARAVGLAENLELLELLRANLRQMMLRSPLLDTVGFTRNLEAAYRDMWRRWCQAQLQSAP